MAANPSRLRRAKIALAMPTAIKALSVNGW
ncbi:MAG: hypothetical protein GDYSWBUE_000227 [Candidatus Fervidibacterota bacterium]